MAQVQPLETTENQESGDGSLHLDSPHPYSKMGSEDRITQELKGWLANVE